MTVNMLKEISLSPEDNLDGLLREFFQAEMPHPWPACPAPAASVVPYRPTLPARTWLSGPTRSRLALAASVALLIVGSLFLAGVGSVPAPDLAEPNIGARDFDRAEKPKLPDAKYRQTEGLLQKSDGTYYQIEFFELPPPK